MDKILDTFSTSSITLTQFIITLLKDEQYKDHPFVSDLVSHTFTIQTLLERHTSKHLEPSQECLQWALSVVRKKYLDEMAHLIDEGTSWRFSAANTKAHQINTFKIEEMARTMKIMAPQLWNLLGDMLDAQHLSSIRSNQNANLPPSTEHHNAAMQDDLDETYWDNMADLDLEGIIETIREEVSDDSRKKRNYARRQALITVKRVVILSILMQSSNQKMNALESIIGIFLHACNAPEKVIETLAHVGISISVDSIHKAISSLSIESSKLIQEMGQSLLVAYAYDNFDVDLKTSQPTAEKSTTTLKHLTSALMFPLQHGTTLDDLRVSEDLWSKSRLNLNADPSMLPTARSWTDLLRLHPDKSISSSQTGLTRRDRFNSWKFLQDLCMFGPSYFHQFRPLLGEPEVVEQIPLIKTPIVPLRAMEYSNSTVSGNISTIQNLMEQAGIGDPNDVEIEYEVKDMTLYVIMFHGDLGTGDRILAIQLRRSIEKSPWNRFQYCIFVPGLFHVKMACADAVWRIFLKPPDARLDETSLMQDVGKLRPKETGIIASNPGFRRMHQVIMHAGVCRRLDCWRTEVLHKNPGVTTLEEFANMKPSLDDLKTLANTLATSSFYIARHHFGRLRNQPSTQRDLQHENAILFNKYSLLYEELSHSMNYGDIGRVETCLVPWILIFRATGKTKYSKHMIRFLTETHFEYGEGLQKAVRYSMLINPTGKPGKSRGVDWCVELQNLWTKVDHGGTGSNYTVNRIIKESPLVQAYRSIRTTIEKNFSLHHLTVAHSEADMTKTFKEVCRHLADKNVHRITAGRTSKYSIPDAMDKGTALLMADKGNRSAGDSRDEEEDNDEEHGAAEDDILIEL